MKMFSVAEAAKELGVSAGTVYGLCAGRKLRHERIGLRRGRIRVPQDAIEEYRRRVTVPASEEGGPSAKKSAPRPKLKAAFKHIHVH
jgi:excisionase family DNA binding protein